MYEYKVVPAPVRAAKVKGLKTTAERFAHALAEHINAEAVGGWQFHRSETLSCEERKRFGGVKTTMQTVLVFTRPLGGLRPDAGAALVAAQAMGADRLGGSGGFMASHSHDAPQSEQHAAEYTAHHEPHYTDQDEPRYEPPYQEPPYQANPYPADRYQESPYQEPPYQAAPTDRVYETPEPAYPSNVDPVAPPSLPRDANPAPQHRSARQEPLFRATPLTRPDIGGREPGGRAEPVLRPRQPSPEDTSGH